MPFDAKEFKKEKFQPRIKAVPVEGLKKYFSDGEKPVWKVRNLTANEISQINEEAERYTTVKKMARDAKTEAEKVKVTALKEVLGIYDGLTPDTARRMRALVIGSVEPACDEEMAHKIQINKGVSFRDITDQIFVVTGLGAEPGKLKGSGKKQVSKQA